MTRFRNTLEKLVVYGLLAVVVLSPTQYAVRVAKDTYVSLVDPLVCLLFGLWLLYLVTSRKLRDARLPPLFTLLFVVLALVSVSRAVNKAGALKDSFQYVEYFVVTYMLFVWHLDDAKKLRRLITLFAGAATVIVVLALVQYFSPGIDDFKVRGTFGNRNVLGGYLSLGLPLLFGLSLGERRPWRRAWFLVVIAGGLTACLAGGAWIALTAARVVLAVLRSRIAFVATTAILSLAIAISPHLPRDTIESARGSIALYDDNVEVAPRYTEWQAAGIMVLENATLGVGAGNYQANIGQYYGILPNPAGVKVEADSQNLYLVIASTIGVTGLTCFVGMLAYFAVGGLTVSLRTADPFYRGIGAGVFGSLLAFSINAVWSPLIVRGIGIPLAIVFSLVAALLRAEGKDGG